MLRLKQKTWNEKRGSRRLRIILLSQVGVAVRPRHSLLPVRYPQFDAKLVDGSMVGCRILSEHHLPPGSAIVLWVQVKVDDDVRALKLRGDVVRSENAETEGQYIVGVQLHRRPEKSMALWRNSIVNGIRGISQL